MNLKTRYEIAHSSATFVRGWLSMKTLVILFYALVAFKYYHFGIESFGMYWRPGYHPDLWDHVTTVFDSGIKKHLWMVPLSFVVDYFFWPYCFKDI